jgi:hypothetical protein
MTTGRSRDAPPGRWQRAAGARVAPRVAAADEACGQAAPSTPEPLTDEQKDWARGAWDWGCRVAGRAGCRSFPSQNVHAGRAREARKDQGQVFEILQFQAWKTGRTRVGRDFRHRGAPGQASPIYGFMVCSNQGGLAVGWVSGQGSGTMRTPDLGVSHDSEVWLVLASSEANGWCPVSDPEAGARAG